MKKVTINRIAAWLIAVGMALSPSCTGFTAIPSFAEESSITETTEEETPSPDSESEQGEQEESPADDENQEQSSDETTDDEQQTDDEATTEEENTDEEENTEASDEDALPDDSTETTESADEGIPSIDYINNIPVTINEKVTAFYWYDDSNYVDLRTGCFVAEGNKISMTVAVNDYINHKLTVNGSDVEMALTGDGNDMYAFFIVEENTESIEIDLVESPWTEEQLSEYVVLDLSENVYFWYYNDYCGTTVARAEDGDYLAKNRGYYIDYHISNFDEDAVLKINGTEVECEINEQEQIAWYSYYLSENADFDTLKVEVVTDNGDIPLTFGEKISVVCYPPNSEGESEKHFPSSGSTVSSESYLCIMTDISDAVDHIITINGSEIPFEGWTPNGDGYYLGYGYRIQETDTEISIELIEKAWPDEYKSQYSVFEISRGFYGLSVYYYNQHTHLIGREAQNGDYIHKDAKFSVRYFNGSLPEGYTITINGEEAEYEINNDGVVQIWGYDVPDDSDVVKVALTSPGDIPLSFDEETIRLEGKLYYKNGDKTEVGTRIDISVNINDYINHKLMLNGEEIPLELELTDDGKYFFYGNYTVSEEDTQLEFVLEESQWDEEKLSDFAVVEIDDYIQLYNYNEYSQTAIISYPLENGDYIYKGQKIVVRVPYNYYPDKAVIKINGIQADCFVNNDWEWQIWDYTPTYTDNTLSVKFDNEFSEPVTVFSIYDVMAFDSLEEAFKSYSKADAALTVYVNEPIDESEFNIPKNAESVTIDGIGEIRYHGTTLNIPVNTTINCDISTSAAVKVAAGKTLLFERGSKVFGTVTGTSSSVLISNTDADFDGLSTFGEVWINNNSLLTISGAVKGVKFFRGRLKLADSASTAAITEFNSGELILIETNSKLPKVTITDVTDALNLTVENNTGYLTSGTAVLYTVKNDYTNKITINNKTSLGQDLDPILYKTEIRAEYANAVSVNGKNFPNLEKAVESMTGIGTDYVITLKEASYIKNLVLPKKAGEITIEGEPLTIGNTKLTLSTSTTINCKIIPDNKKGTLDISAAKGTTLTIGSDLSLNALTGTSTTTLITDAHLTVGKLTNFVDVNTGENGSITVTSAAKGIANLYGTLKLTGAKTTAAITNIGTAEIILADANGILPKATVTNIINALDVTVENETGALASGTPVLYITKNDITPKVHITNLTASDQPLTPYLYKKEIRAEYSGAILMNGEGYPNLEKVFEKINNAKNPEAIYVITLKADVKSEKLTLPKYAASITLESENGNVINVGKLTSIAANTELTIKNISFVTTGKSLTINAKKNLTVDGLYGDVTALKGGAKFALNWSETDEETVHADITGFGTVNVADTLVTGRNFNATNLVLADNARFAVSASTVKASVKAVNAGINAALVYEADSIPLTFTGKDDAFNAANGKLSILGDVSNGQAVLVSKVLDLDKLNDLITPEGEEIKYGFTRIGSEIFYMGEVLELKSYANNSTDTYALWIDVVKAIESYGNPSGEYDIILHEDYNANGAVKFPKAGTYSSLCITNNDSDARNFNFTGNLALTGETTFSNINLGAMKNNDYVKYTINAGKNKLSITGCGLAGASAINGTSDIELDSVNLSGSVKAGNLKLSRRNTITSGISAAGLTFGENAELTMHNGSKLTVSKTGISGSNTLTLHIIDKLTGTHSKLRAGTVISSSFKGPYNGQILLDEQNGNFDIVLNGTKLITR